MIRFRDPKQEMERRHQKRFAFFYAGLMVGYGVILCRAVHLMLKDNVQLEEMAMSQYRAAVQNETYRSRILDARGYELAISVPSYSLYADPQMVKDPQKTASALSSALKIPFASLKEKLLSKKKFVWIRRHIDADRMEKIFPLLTDGVAAMKESKRFYPQGPLAGSVLGAVGIDSQALAGIELAYDPYLKIQPKASLYFRDARGKLYRPTESKDEPPATGDVWLTLDKNIQFFAEEALLKAVREHRAVAGTVTVMEANTGAILAMANYPFFNPNRFKNTTWNNWRNRAVTDIYEPGSTFKIVVAAAALESGRVSPGERFECESGAFQIPSTRQVLHDHHPHGRLTLPEILRVSSNIGAFKIGDRVGKKTFHEKILDFGFGQKTGIDFPGESSGLVRGPREWGPVDTGTIAFGQGIGVTPLQLLSAFQALANKGVQMRPYLTQKVMDKEGRIFYEARPEVIHRPVREKTAGLLTGILEGVVREGGTAPAAALAGYVAAGKSGTAQKADPERKIYLERKYVASFAGYAPARNPRLVILVILDEPQGRYYGGQVAAPVFREVADFALKYLGIPPRGKTPVRNAAVPAENHRQWHAMTREGKKIRVPDFQGASKRQVLRAMEGFSVNIRFEGRGIAVRQRPTPGSLVAAGSRVSVEFQPPY